MAPASRALSVVAPLPSEKKLSLLGGFVVSLGGQPVSLPASVQRLVAFLALNVHPSSRVLAASTLWPDGTEARAGSSLRSVVWRLGLVAPWLLDAGNGLALADDVAIDIREASVIAGRLSSEVGINPERLELGPFLLDLLPDWYEDWVIMERERYRQTRLHALEALCQLLTARGRHARAVDAGLAAVAGEPLRESAHRVLIAAHLAEGNVSEAVRQYRSYRRLLWEELGVEPSSELESLVDLNTR
jgi:DNA-binding SARP family transcriptional activator